jgi:hypothetical protein
LPQSSIAVADPRQDADAACVPELGRLDSEEGIRPGWEVAMGTKQPATTRGGSSKRGACPEGSERSPTAAALAEIGRAVREDCRVDPKAYLDEVRVAASGE